MYVFYFFSNQKDFLTQDSKIQNVIDAVYVYAYALDKLQNETCQFGGLCDELRNLTKNKTFGKDFYEKYLLNVTFSSKWCPFETKC